MKASVIDRRDASMVRARVRVDKSTPVKSDSTAIIDFAGITGVTFIQINAGTEGMGPLQRKPGEDVPVDCGWSDASRGAFRWRRRKSSAKASIAIDQANKLLTDENIAAFGETLVNVRDITGSLSQHDDDLLAQTTKTMASLERAGDDLSKAAIEAASVANSVETELQTLNVELKALVAELNTATGAASATLAESRKAIEAATALVEGGASDTLQQTGLAAQEMRILISRLDRIARELEQNPQGLVVGNPLPYEEKR